MKNAILIKALLILTLPIAFLSCQNNATRQDNKKPQTQNVKAIDDSLEKDYLPLQEMRICGKLPMESSLNNLKSLLGNPDSVVTPDMNNVCTSYYERAFDHYYVKGITFEKYGDTVVFSGIDFIKNSKTFLTFNKLRLDGTTHLSDIKKAFPVSGAEVSDVKNEDGTYAAVRLPLSEIVSDDSFLLLFDKNTGRLKRVEYYMPC